MVRGQKKHVSSFWLVSQTTDIIYIPYSYSFTQDIPGFYPHPPPPIARNTGGHWIFKGFPLIFFFGGPLWLPSARMLGPPRESCGFRDLYYAGSATPWPKTDPYVAPKVAELGAE